MRQLLGIIALATAVASPAIAVTPAERARTDNHQIAALIGEPGCTAISEDDVIVVPHGFMIARLKEFVPYEDASPSPDGRYWRCVIAGQRSRFMAPDSTD